MSNSTLIAYSTPQVDAEQNRDVLYERVMDKLSKDASLEQRLELVETQLRMQANASLLESASIRDTDNDDGDSDTATIRQGQQSTDPVFYATNPCDSIALHDFEQHLMSSWVYKRSEHREEDMSFRSSVVRLSAWSVLSELSLANISMLSVICLPIQLQELSNGEWYARVISEAGAQTIDAPAASVVVTDGRPSTADRARRASNIIPITFIPGITNRFTPEEDAQTSEARAYVGTTTPPQLRLDPVLDAALPDLPGTANVSERASASETKAGAKVTVAQATVGSHSEIDLVFLDLRRATEAATQALRKCHTDLNMHENNARRLLPDNSMIPWHKPLPLCGNALMSVDALSYQLRTLRSTPAEKDLLLQISKRCATFDRDWADFRKELKNQGSEVYLVELEAVLTKAASVVDPLLNNYFDSPYYENGWHPSVGAQSRVDDSKLLSTAVADGPTTDSSSEDETDEVVYACKGCGEILEQGKAFELASNRWHIDCFRCNTCGTLLDSDANLLLLGDGSLVCNDCTYDCSSCGLKIEDLAILTGDLAFCASCFRCRNCKRKIENLRYARTTQGIFCMSCHESLMARRRKKARSKSTANDVQHDASPAEIRHLAS